MEQKVKRRGQAFSLIFTMLLFLVFVLCALFTVLIGGKVYENINVRMEENYTNGVVLGYVANKIRQGDSAGMVDVTIIDGTQVLELKQQIGDQTYVTMIYYRDGSVRELFTTKDSGLALDAGLPVISCEGLSLEKNGNLLILETEGQERATLWLTLRSGGQEND